MDSPRPHPPPNPSSNHSNHPQDIDDTYYKKDHSNHYLWKDFPTAQTVPFPYEKPYPQQEALMDTLLQSLKSLGNNDNHNDNHNNYDKKKKKKVAKVMLLESPTGTGKSLSLACASLAWLNFMEQMDLHYGSPNHNVNDGDDAPGSTNTTNVNITNNNDSNWLESYANAWANTPRNPSHVQRQQEQILQQKCHTLAQQTRTQLEQEIHHIRTKITHLSHSSKLSESNVSLYKRKILPARQNVARTAVTAAMMAERKRYQLRQKQRQKRSRMQQRKTSTTSKMLPQHSNVNQTTQDHFCVEDYRSDDNHPNEEKDQESDSNSNSSSSSEEEKNDTMSLSSLKFSKQTIQSSSLHHHIHVTNLLQGSFLDGSHSNALASSSSFSSSKIHPHIPSPSFKSKSTTSSTSTSTMTVGNVPPGSGVRKIIYAARTHSQLSQFISEIRRTHWGKTTRVVALGSRKLLCGNTSINHSSKHKYKSEASVTEDCLDLQKGFTHDNPKTTTKKRTKSSASSASASSGGSGGCPLLSSREAVSTLALHMLAQPSDIEDLASLGTSSHSCAYYASRESIPAAQVVVVPYNTLLSKEARNTIGLSLQQNLVLIDEAHNIPEALRSLHACRLSLPVLEASLKQLILYVSRYSSRLSTQNLFYIGQIRRCVQSMIQYLSNRNDYNKIKNNNSRLLSTQELLFALKLDNVNLFKIERYLERSRLPQKLLGFMNFESQSQSQSQPKNHSQNQSTQTITNQAVKESDDDPSSSMFGLSKHVSPLSIVRTFLTCLNTCSLDGKIVVEWPSSPSNSSNHTIDQHASFRYVLLNPSSQFQDILQEAHAVALIGGTIRPFAHMTSELMDATLLPNALEEAMKADQEAQQSSSTSTSCTSSSSSSITTFSCGHVVSPSHVCTLCLSMGPTSTKLDFRHKHRSSDQVCDELGRTLLNVCNVVPHGMVVFLPSYSYEAHLVRRWKFTNLWNQLERKKCVYREPPHARDVEQTLTSYARDSSEQKGAIMLCVVGGKVSEGINFANDMARCAMIVGLPYADITDPELQEKMQSLDASYNHQGSSIKGITGQSYYRNLCLRAVNQSIGRAIRHANDYAAVILADARYSSDRNVWTGLPNWLRKGQTLPPTQPSFGKALVQLKTFFIQMQQEQ